MLCRPADQIHWTVSPIWILTDAGMNLSLPFSPTWTCTVAALTLGSDARNRRENVTRTGEMAGTMSAGLPSAERVPIVGTIGDCPGKNFVTMGFLFSSMVVSRLLVVVSDGAILRLTASGIITTRQGMFGNSLVTLRCPRGLFPTAGLNHGVRPSCRGK